MACGCNKTAANANRNNPVIGPLRLAARRPNPPRAAVPFTPEQLSPALDADRRRIEKARRDAVKRSFNK